MILISNAIFGWWVFKFWTVDLLKSLNPNWQCYHCIHFWMSCFVVPEVLSRDTQKDLSNHIPLQDLLDDTHPLTASGWISRKTPRTVRGESAFLSTWSKKSITFKAISREKSWEKSPTLDLQIDPKDLVSSTCTQPVVLAPPKSSHLVSYQQWPKPCLFVVYRRLFRDYFTNTMNSGSWNLDQSGFPHPYHSRVLLRLLIRWKWP